VNADELLTRTAGRVLFRGRPAWIDERLVEDLREEAAALRGEAQQIERQLHGFAGPRGHGLATCSSLTELVTDLAGPVRPSGNANYLYYDQAGAGIDPHIDSPDFPLQVLFMVDHQGYEERRSTLVVFPTGPQEPVPVPLDPGELVLFRAASIVHGRTSVGEAERAVLLGIGYVPVDDSAMSPT
jgi:hypothetical protein